EPSSLSLHDALPICHQHSAKFFAEDALGHGGVPMAVQVEIAQVIIAGVPDPKGLAILTPGSFIAMGHRQGSDFVSQVFIQRTTSDRKSTRLNSSHDQ